MSSSPASDSLTIGRLARAADVGVETIRYYQDRKLLPVPPRRRGFPLLPDEPRRADPLYQAGAGARLFARRGQGAAAALGRHRPQVDPTSRRGEVVADRSEARRSEANAACPQRPANRVRAHQGRLAMPDHRQHPSSVRTTGPRNEASPRDLLTPSEPRCRAARRPGRKDQIACRSMRRSRSRVGAYAWCAVRPPLTACDQARRPAYDGTSRRAAMP